MNFNFLRVIGVSAFSIIAMTAISHAEDFHKLKTEADNDRYVENIRLWGKVTIRNHLCDGKNIDNDFLLIEQWNENLTDDVAVRERADAFKSATVPDCKDDDDAGRTLLDAHAALNDIRNYMLTGNWK